MQKITITEMMNGPWKERAIATCEERGIVSIADGLKPVHRFLIYQGCKMCKGKYDKVAAIGGTVASAGYEHGEASACGALVGLSAYFSNNLPLFIGKGSFGNVLDPTAAAHRYIFSKMNPIFENIYKDNELVPKHPDPENLPPLYYLPIIPMCLVNGSTGLATGYASRIPPHDPVSIIDWYIAKCQNKKPKTIKPKYYGFTGTIERQDDCYKLTGIYDKISNVKYKVTELPHTFWTSQSYEMHLRKLEEKGKILKYENNSVEDKFEYVITLKNNTKWTEEDEEKYLKVSCNDKWNLTMIRPNGKLHVYDKKNGIEEILQEFYEFRLPYYSKRIENIIRKLELEIKWKTAYIKFCKDVIANKFNFKIDDEEFEKVLLEKYKMPTEYIQTTMNTPVRNFTKKSLEKYENQLEKIKEDYEYYKNTSPEEEWIKDLEVLKKSL